MKYTQYSQRKKGSSAFYIVIALSLVLIGAAAWFAFTRMDENNSMQRNMSSVESKFESKWDEYTSDIESYTESMMPDTSSQTTPSDNIMEDPNLSQPNQEQTTAAETEKIKAYTMPVNGEILKDFNTEALQFSATYNDMRIHAAVDIACNEGTRVSACSDGKISDIETSAEYGKIVTIDHGDGLVVKYCGLKNVTVEKDTAVKMGDSIGAVGTIPSECSDQSHLHIECFENGKSVSILKFFE